MRVKGSMSGEGAAVVDLKKLYYLSVHTLDNAEGVKYAKNRVAREVLDRWMDSKLEYAGLKFSLEEIKLTETAARLCLALIACLLCEIVRVLFSLLFGSSA